MTTDHNKIPAPAFRSLFRLGRRHFHGLAAFDAHLRRVNHRTNRHGGREYGVERDLRQL